MMCLKIAGQVANSVDHDQMPLSVDLVCFLRPVCPYIEGKYGTDLPP